MKNTATVLDLKAKTLATDYLRTEGELLSVLIEMRKERIFSILNYSGIFDYCVSELRLSRAQAYYFKTVAEKSEEVPELVKAISDGQITLSEARRITPVITKLNHLEWIEKAKTFSQLELERQVTAVNPSAHTKEKIKPIAKDLSELKVTIDAEMEEDIKALREILSQKTGKPASLKDVIQWTIKVCRDKFDPIRKAERFLSKKQAAPTGKQGAINNKNFSLGKKPQIETIETSKTQNISVQQRKRLPIPAAIQHQVNLRDLRQCTFQDGTGRRCQQKRWLHFHHNLEVSRGGLNNIENLKLVCSWHHRLLHGR